MTKNFGLGVSRVLEDAAYGWEQLIFKEFKPPLYSEVNLTQQIQAEERAKSLRLLYPSGFIYPSIMQGGVSGKSPKSNAQIHTQQDLVLTLDIRDFFPSIRYSRIFDLFIGTGVSPEVSKVLTRITTYNYHLAQGFPTSSTLANLILAKILPRVTNLCEQYQITFTTYRPKMKI